MHLLITLVILDGLSQDHTYLFVVLFGNIVEGGVQTANFCNFGKVGSFTSNFYNT